MHPAFVLLANKSATFGLYDFHLQGVPIKTLAAAYSLPTHWVEEHIEAICLCLTFQVKLVFDSPGNDNECRETGSGIETMDRLIRAVRAIFAFGIDVLTVNPVYPVQHQLFPGARSHRAGHST